MRGRLAQWFYRTLHEWWLSLCMWITPKDRLFHEHDVHMILTQFPRIFIATSISCACKHYRIDTKYFPNMEEYMGIRFSWLTLFLLDKKDVFFDKKKDVVTLLYARCIIGSKFNFSIFLWSELMKIQIFAFLREQNTIHIQLHRIIFEFIRKINIIDKKLILVSSTVNTNYMISIF